MKKYICYWSIEVNNNVPDDVEVVYFFDRVTGELNFPDLKVGMNNWDGYINIFGDPYPYNKEEKKFENVVHGIIYKRELAYISQMLFLATKMVKTFTKDVAKLKGIVLTAINNLS